MVIRSLPELFFGRLQRYLHAYDTHRHRVSTYLHQEIRTPPDQVSSAPLDVCKPTVCLQQGRDYLIEIAAHDLNNYLTGIAGLAEVAQFTLPSSHAASNDLNEIKRLAIRAGNLASRLLARNHSTKEHQLISLNQIIADAEMLLRRIIGEHIVLTITYAPDLGLVEAAPDQLEQVLINLVLNARDAMPLGGTITITTSAVPSSSGMLQSAECGREKQYVMMSVSDTGIGMDAPTQARLFEPFFTTKASVGGNGVGLVACKHIIDEHGGEIQIESTLGGGTRVSAFLPSLPVV